MRSPEPHATSLDLILVKATAVVTSVFIIITLVTFQSLPPLPTAKDFLSSNQSINPTVDAATNIFEETFPQRISDVSFETIRHPAVSIISTLDVPNMTVPAFYDPPQFEEYNGIRSYLGNYGESLMTLEQAQNIGSKVNGHETIFVAIASYRDFQCRQTVESIFTRATHPERIRVAVVDQIDKDQDTPCSQPEEPCESDPSQVLCKYEKQIDFFTMEAQFAMGPVFARHLGHRMYRGEYFAIQCDAHVDFVLDWDSSIIKQWKSAKNEMAVLSAYLSDVHGSMDAEGHLLRDTRPIMCNSDYEDSGLTQHLRHGQQPEGKAGIHDEPTLEPYWAAGFSFSRGHFVVNVPYDQHLPWVFQGEEISIGLRGFTYGYDYYTPETSPCFHYYASMDKTGKRNKVKLFWENRKSFGSKEIKKVELGAFLRLNGIIQMNPPSVKEDQWVHIEEKKYGIGQVRSPKKFFDSFGIDLKNHKVEKHLCKFVGRNMHLIWKQYLREDTMGIDYDKITFKFKDPDKYGMTWDKYLPKS
jgi:[Skp1-protein]-hydroxyproline N-acetylglucosaminyltransferase